MFERLMKFVIQHERCDGLLNAGHAGHAEARDSDIVLRCPGCGAGLSVGVTVEEAKTHVLEACRVAGFKARWTGGETTSDGDWTEI
jgi:hypothetical protein